MTRICDLTMQGGLLFLIIYTPLAFGSVYPWSIALMEGVVLCMALAWVLKLLYMRRLQVVRTSLNLTILLFLGLIGLQVLPLPPIVLYVISPHTYGLYQQTLAGWPDRDPLPLVPRHAVSQQPIAQQTDNALSLSSQEQGLSAWSVEGGDDPGVAYTSRWRPLSLYPHATWAELSLACTYTMIFLITVNNVRSQDQLNRVLLTLICVGGIVAVLWLIQKVSGTETVYWFWPPRWGDSPFGPYVNRNHFAGYMAMVLPLGLGWLWGQLVQGNKSDRIAGWRWRARLAAVVGGRNGLLLLFALALAHMAVALLFSASRGGIVSCISSLLFFTLLVRLSRRGERHIAVAGLVLTAFVLAYALWLGIDHVLQRFMAIDFEEGGDRIPYWSATLGLIGEFPLLGTGLGTYMHGFRRYSPVLEQVLVDHAHNDYLELLAEAGTVGFLLVVGGLGWFCWRTLKHWFTRQDPQVLGIVLGGLTSVLAIGIHSLVDFNLHIPANALLLSVILGLTCVAVHLRQHQGRSVVVFRVMELGLPRPLRLAMYPLTLVLMLALASGIGKSFAADRQAALAKWMERRAQSIVVLETVAEQWAQVVALDPDNADYHYHLGSTYESLMHAQRASDAVRALVAGVRAMVEYREAILRNPTSPHPYLAWSWTLDSVRRLAASVAKNRLHIATSDDLGGHRLSYVIARLTQHPDSATQWSQQLAQTATHLEPTAAFAHYSTGLYALQQWETLPAEERTRVVQQLRSAVLLEPKYANDIVEALWEWTQDRDLVQALARGTSEEALWRGNDKNAPSAR
jgi:O-antigen ligase